MEIQNIDVRWPGSVHYARIFDNICLCARFEHGEILGMLLGDSGSPCRQYLMTPPVDPQTAAERRYNVSHIRTRNTVERMFGIWKRLFPCLSMTLRTKLQTTLTIIVATAVLYNFMGRRNDPMDDSQLPPPAVEELPASHGAVGGLGNAQRRALIMQHFT